MEPEQPTKQHLKQHRQQLRQHDKSKEHNGEHKRALEPRVDRNGRWLQRSNAGVSAAALHVRNRAAGTAMMTVKLQQNGTPALASCIYSSPAGTLFYLFCRTLTSASCSLVRVPGLRLSRAIAPLAPPYTRGIRTGLLPHQLRSSGTNASTSGALILGSVGKTGTSVWSVHTPQLPYTNRGFRNRLGDPQGLQFRSFCTSEHLRSHTKACASGLIADTERNRPHVRQGDTRAGVRAGCYGNSGSPQLQLQHLFCPERATFSTVHSTTTELISWRSPYFYMSRGFCSTSGNELASVSSSRRRFLSQFSAGTAFSMGAVWGGFVFWLASFMGLFTGGTVLCKSRLRDSEAKADAVAIGRRDSKVRLQHVQKSEDVDARVDTTECLLADVKAGGRSPHYPGGTLPTTELVLQNPGYTSIFCATRRVPILVAEKFTKKKKLGSSQPSEDEEQQPQISVEEEEEVRLQMNQLWGGGSSRRNNTQPSEISKYLETLEERLSEGEKMWQSLTRGAAALLGQEQQSRDEGDAAASREYALSAPSLRDKMSFRQDPRIDVMWSPSSSDYTNSGYARGHMAPAASHSATVDSLRSTFYLGANIVPQNQSLNTSTWKRLETLCRYLTTVYDEVYVVTGPLWLPKDIESSGPQVYVTVDSQGRVQGSANPPADKKAEASGEVGGPKYGSVVPVKYTCIRPYAGSSAYYAVSHESLAGTPSPAPVSSRPLDLSDGGSSLQTGASFVGVGEAQDVDNQMLEKALVKCKKVLRSLAAFEAESSSASTGTEATGLSPSVAISRRAGDWSERAMGAWGEGRQRTRIRDGKHNPVKMSARQEAATWSALRDDNDFETDDEESYPLLPGAAVLRGLLKDGRPPLHMEHETIGTRMVAVPTHLYKIILAIRSKSPKQLLRAAIADSAASSTWQSGAGQRDSSISQLTAPDPQLPPVILAAFLMPNKKLVLKKPDFRTFRVSLGFLEFASGLSFKAVVDRAAGRIRSIAEEEIRAGAFAEDDAGAGLTAPAARLATSEQ